MKNNNQNQEAGSMNHGKLKRIIRASKFMTHLGFNNKRKWVFLSLLLIVFPILILGAIIFINQNNPYKNAQLLVASDTFKSYEMPKFKLILNEEKTKLSFIQAFAQDEVKVEAKIINSEGEVTDLETDITTTDNQTYDISVKPILRYRPGSYTIETKIYSTIGDRTITQDFSWGVLAFNTNKATYRPGETVNVSIGILDERGLMVCGASVELEIISPSGEKKTLTSANGDISVHEVCKSFEFTLEPDFSTSFTLPDQEGEYQMKLTAQTHNGTHTIEDYIRVSNNIPFEIERISATRTYPLNDYPMHITIKANQDFAGTITETVPTSFDIMETHQSGLETDYAAFTTKKEIEKTIEWEVDMKKGETYTFDYVFDPPNVSPEFFLMGNLIFEAGIKNYESSEQDESRIMNKDHDSSFMLHDSENVVFTEGRYWQIANDATDILTTGTTWSVPADWDDATNSIHVIGGGGGGAGANLNGTTEVGGGGGGAGGVYATSSNVNMPEGSSVTYAIGSAGSLGAVGSGGTAGGDTYICDSTSNCASIGGTAVKVGGKGGGGGNGGSNLVGGTGGTTQSGSVGTTTRNGGDGGTGGTGLSGGTRRGGSGAGGGGAAGPNSTGNAGGSPAGGADGGTGGQGDGASGGTGGTGGTFGATCTVGGTGNAGTEWTTAGSGGGGGGGGGGANGAVGCNGGAGGNYGAGGGGGGGRGRGAASSGTGANGTQGVIYISYTPLVLEINVSGNVYNAGTTTALTECDADSGTHELSLRHNGATYTTSCSSTDGSFTFANVIHGASDTGIVIWIDDAEAPETDGALVIRYDGSGDSTNNIFYDDTVTITSDDTNPVTNAHMDVYDNGNDADIPYTVTSNNLTVNSGYGLLVKIKSGVTAGSDVYDPGGTITTNATGGDFHIDDNSDAYIDTATSSIGRDIIIDSGGTLTISADNTVGGGDITATGTLASSGTPTVTIRGTGNISGAGTKTIYNLVVGDGITATTTLTGNLSVTNNASVGTGSTFNVNADLGVTGSLTNTTTGIINTTSGTPTVTVQGASLGGGSGALTFYNLTKSGAGTTTFSGSGTNTVSNNLSVSAGIFTQSNTLGVTGDVSVSTGATYNQNAALTINGGDLITAGTGVVNTTAGTGTVTINGTGGQIGGGGAVTVYNLVLGGSGTQTLASALTATSDISVPAGKTLALGSQNVTVNGGDFTTTSTGSITCSGCSAGTVTMSGTGALGGGSGAITFYNLATSGTGTTTFSGSGTNTVSNNVTVGAGTTLNLNSTIGITGSLINTTTGIIGYSSGTPTVTVSGTSIGGGSGAITFYNLTKSGAGTTTFSGSGTNTVSNNLSISAGTFTQSNTLTVTNDVSAAAGTTTNINGNLNVNGGDFITTTTAILNTTAGTPTITLSGTGTLGGGSGAKTFYNLATTGTGTTAFSGTGTNTVNNNVTVGTGTTLNLNDNISITGSLTNTTTGIINTTSGTPTVTVQGASLGGGSGNITFYNLTKSGAGTTTFSGSGTNTVNNNLSISAGTLNGTGSMTVGSSAVSNSGGVSVAGTLSMTGGTFTLGSSTGGSATVGGAGSITFYNLTFGPTVASAPTFTLGSAGSQTINVSNDLTIGNGTNPVTVTANSNNPTINVDRDFTISANGSFTAPPTSNFTVARNFTNNGTFTPNGGEVILDTTNNSIIDGSGTPAVLFYDLTSTTPNKVIDFTQSKTFEIDGVFTITGSSGNLIGITSTTTTQWLIDLDGSASVTYANISNSGCASGSITITLDATNYNGGNNGTCWDFGEEEPPPASNKKTIQGGTTIRGGTTIKQ